MRSPSLISPGARPTSPDTLDSVDDAQTSADLATTAPGEVGSAVQPGAAMVQ